MIVSRDIRNLKEANQVWKEFVERKHAKLSRSKANGSNWYMYVLRDKKLEAKVWNKHNTGQSALYTLLGNAMGGSPSDYYVDSTTDVVYVSIGEQSSIDASDTSYPQGVMAFVNSSGLDNYVNSSATISSSSTTITASWENTSSATETIDALWAGFAYYNSSSGAPTNVVLSEVDINSVSVPVDAIAGGTIVYTNQG